jgi:putative tricarboxylic transport membrane protein
MPPAERTPGRDLIIALVLCAFGVLVMVLARGIPLGVSTDPLGPRAFPFALGAGIGLCGVLLAAGVLLFRGSGSGHRALLSDAGLEDDDAGGPFSPARFIGTIAATAVYLILFEPVGYLITTPLYVAVVMLLHGGAGPRAFLVAPFAATVALYVTFRFGLRIPIPDGILEGFLPLVTRR